MAKHSAQNLLWSHFALVSMEMRVMQWWQREKERGHVAGCGVTALHTAGSGGHKLSLYLGHWGSAPAATRRQDTIMQEEE